MRNTCVKGIERPDGIMIADGGACKVNLRRYKMVSVLSTAISLLGCAHYRELPIDMADARRHFETRSLRDREIIDSVASSLSPEEAAKVQEGVWGQSALLIAAIHFNPKINEARAHVKEVLGAATTAKSLPNVTLGLAGEYDLSRVEESPWLWSISTDFLLDAVLQQNLKSRLAASQVRVARLDYAEAIWTIRKELRAALLASVIAQQRVALLVQLNQESEKLSRLMRERREVGESSATEQLQAELQVSRARSSLRIAERDSNLAHAQLAAAVGVTLQSIESITLQWTNLESPVLPADSVLDELRQRALLSRPDIERGIADYQTREIELHQQIRAQYPQVSIGPGFTWDHGVRKATLGVSFSIPAFSRNRGPIAEALARREVAGEHLLALQAVAINDIDAGRRGFAAALASLAAAIDQAQASDALSRSVARGVQLGAEDNVALATANIAANSDALAKLDGIERMQQALGQWEDALRSPLEDPHTDIRASVRMP